MFGYFPGKRWNMKVAFAPLLVLSALAIAGCSQGQTAQPTISPNYSQCQAEYLVEQTKQIENAWNQASEVDPANGFKWGDRLSALDKVVVHLLGILKPRNCGHFEKLEEYKLAFDKFVRFPVLDDYAVPTSAFFDEYQKVARLLDEWALLNGLESATFPIPTTSATRPPQSDEPKPNVSRSFSDPCAISAVNEQVHVYANLWTPPALVQNESKCNVIVYYEITWCDAGGVEENSYGGLSERPPYCEVARASVSLKKNTSLAIRTPKWAIDSQVGVVQVTKSWK